MMAPFFCPSIGSSAAGSSKSRGTDPLHPCPLCVPRDMADSKVASAAAPSHGSASAHIHGYNVQMVMQVQTVIDDAYKGDVAPLSAVYDIFETLLAKGHAKKVRLHPSEVGVHPSNRGTFGLNGYNCHRNGNEIDVVGCDVNELSKAMAFEVSGLPADRAKQLAFNKKVIDGSSGLLAPLCGREGYLSVGTGHFTGWVRAINHGCRTPFKSLAENGKLSADRFKQKDKRMAVCLEHGWDWYVFPWQAEVAWPTLPDLCQRALNASHGVSSRSTELECMMWFAEAYKGKDDATTFKDISKMLTMASPPCASYMDIVGHLAVQISGGVNAPMLMFLDRVQKLYGENKNLGEEFITSVVRLHISKLEAVPFVRAATVRPMHTHGTNKQSKINKCIHFCLYVLR